MLGFSALMAIAAIICMVLALQTRKGIRNITLHIGEINDRMKGEDRHDQSRLQDKIDTMVREGEGRETIKSILMYSSWGCLVAALILGVMAAVITVSAGHVKVVSLFGKVLPDAYPEGIHLINPLMETHLYDTRQKTHKEAAGVPSADKLITKIDVSVQFRAIAGATPEMLQDTGSIEDVIRVHMVPKLRSVLREQGKSVPQAQDFFLEATQTRLQDTLQVSLSGFMGSKGIQIDQVLIRNIVLPEVIRTAIEMTKEREQKVEQQQAELDRFAKEQEQKVATAQAEYDAALLEAQQIKVLADADAYKIEQLNKQLDSSPRYIELIKAQKWDGILPRFMGGEGSIPMIDLRGQG